MFEKSFEEALKLADAAENREQSGNTAQATNRATKTAETVLTNSPAVFTLAIGWQSSQVTLTTSPILKVWCDNVLVLEREERGGCRGE